MASVAVPSHATTGSGGAAANQGVVIGEIEQARGNLQSLRGKVQRWEAKLGRCREFYGEWECLMGESCGQKSFGGEVPAKRGSKGN